MRLAGSGLGRGENKGKSEIQGSFAALRMTTKNKQRIMKTNNSKYNSRSPSGMTTRKATAKARDDNSKGNCY